MEIAENRHSCCVIVPAFNEGDVLGGVIETLRTAFPWVVVVDDGSLDETGEIALRAGATVLRHPINLGQGASLQTGMTYALRKGADYVATFDADGQHDVSDLKRMFARLQEKKLDIVMGSRFLGNAENIPPFRKGVLKLALAFTRFSTGLNLTDVHNGLRILTAEAARKIVLSQNGMSHASEFLEQIAVHKLAYAEEPVTIRYTEYSLKKGQKLWNSFVILSDLLFHALMKRKG